MKNLLKHIGVFAFFVVITILYFSPKLDGKVIQQGDIQKWEGMSHELVEYYQKEGGSSAWTGSMFSGMPSYTVSIQTSIPNSITWPEKIFSIFGDYDCGPIILSLFAMYILLIVMGVPIPLAILGAVGFAFSSYSLIIIQAGHVTKVWAMAYMPLVLTGMVLLFKKKWFAGFFVLATSLSLEIYHNHFQITYYLVFLCLAIFLGYLVNAIIQKEHSDIIKTVGFTLASVAVAIAINSSRLYSNWEMSKTSIRGKSELSSNVDKKTDKSSGLDYDYAFAWSYGVSETMTILIPNFNGGASVEELSKESNIAKAMKKEKIPVPKKLQSYTYWGDQPFTSGPVYFGAIICFLFVLSLFVVKNKYKWWIVGVTAFCIILSWGKNFPGINDFLFHYMPMYNKFRTPSMALVIPQLTFPLLGCMALYTIWKGNEDKAFLMKSLFIAGGITGGLCLIFAIMPSLFLNFVSPNDATCGFPDWYMDALLLDRKAILTSDALRSFVFILLASLAIFFMITKKGDNKVALIVTSCLALLILGDLWSVDKRYLNDSHFVREKRKNSFAMTAADKAILKDKDLSYRVLTLNNPFNDTNVSYYHKSIGGYNAAKLRRYQELIDMYISPEMQQVVGSLRNAKSVYDVDNAFENTPVLNMLNMRYLIFNETVDPIQNTKSFGNAWFVDEVKMVNNADEEMTSLGKINPRKTALVDVRFKDLVSNVNPIKDSAASVELISYKPDELKYKTSSSQDGVMLFSEVYYQPGWKAYIDGKETDHFRANWILRGMNVPAGVHEIRFEFYPNTFWNLRWTGFWVALILLLGATAYTVFYYMKKRTAVSTEVATAKSAAVKGN
ncbi:MAG: YfhO family protein [Paludibacteraceae bacterium]|nr:YfhO family protein [Paludibacteraceae bacterium]